MGRYPEQTSLQRKEQLYMDAVRLFNEGKSWECGIPLCKELATLYETDLYNYTKLAKILVSNSYNGRNFSSVGPISKFFSFSENLEKTASDGMFSSKNNVNWA